MIKPRNVPRWFKAVKHAIIAAVESPPMQTRRESIRTFRFKREIDLTMNSESSALH